MCHETVHDGTFLWARSVHNITPEVMMFVFTLVNLFFRLIYPAKYQQMRREASCTTATIPRHVHNKPRNIKSIATLATEEACRLYRRPHSTPCVQIDIGCTLTIEEQHVLLEYMRVSLEKYSRDQKLELTLAPTQAFDDNRQTCVIVCIQEEE